jgi:ubiquinone/menaquinone biosynthesis C-methylase UbiE
MGKEKRPYVCPAELAGGLDNVLRKLVHNPVKILEPYIRKGMKVLDIGCGPGYFTAGLASLVGGEGLVIAADLQQAMLDKAFRKISGTDLEKRVKMHKCQEDNLGLSEKVDFILAFWMVHEIPDQKSFFKELNSILNEGGRILIIEPKIHVTAKSFEKMISHAESAGFKINESPGVWISRTVLLSLKNEI